MTTRVLLRGSILGLLVLALAVCSTAQLSGNYTIDPAGSGPKNYATFALATAALANGVSGPVTFSVASTTFAEAVVINPVTGTSATNTVTFIATGPAAVINATGQQDGLKILKPCSYLIFDNLKVQNASRYGLNLGDTSSARTAMWLQFLNCEFEVAASTSSSVRAGHLYYPNDCIFRNCKFLGGGRSLYTQQTDQCLFDSCEFDGKMMASQVISLWNNNDSDNCYINCFFHSCGPTGYVIHVNYSQYGIMFWNNTVIGTTSQAVVFGGCCAWSRANCFRNNIVVQHGTGAAMRYGLGAGLDYNDLNYNCYYAPNSTNGAVEIEGGLFSGTLAQWKLVLQYPLLKWFPPGGGTNWDQNSIEANPQLMSDVPPYDIHLKGTSPCINAGTTNYIPGAWISFPPASHPFLPSTVTLDFEGQPRGTTPDIGADEVTISIVGSGSGMVGTSITYALIAPSEPNLTYQTASSLGTGPIPIDTRQLNLDFDGLFVASTSGNLPTIFQNYQGTLSASGLGASKLNIPNIAALKGTRIYTAFVTIKLGAPSGISGISNSFLVTIQ